MSMPTRRKIGIYSFYIEISGTFDQEAVLVETVKKMTAVYTIHSLGLYALWAVFAVAFSALAASRAFRSFARWYSAKWTKLVKKIWVFAS